jgi:hypothetical protein
MPVISPMPPYSFQTRKPDVLDDPLPTVTPPDTSRVFILPVFSPDGDYLSTVDVKGNFFDGSNVLTTGHYDAQLWLYISGDVSAWVKYGEPVVNNHQAETVSLPFGTLFLTPGGVPTLVGDVQAFVQITNATSADGVRMVFDCLLNADAPTARDAQGRVVPALPPGAATLAEQIVIAGKLDTLIADTVPASQLLVIVPSDATDTTAVTTKGLFVATTGSLVVKGLDGVSATFPVVAGQYVPVRVSRVMAATTASVVGLSG